MLDDSARASTLESLASGYSAELVRELSSTPWAGAGNFSPYVASLLDIVHLFDQSRTAQYQYIPALSVENGDRFALLLNAPPSFRNPQSVLVAALPGIAAESPPRLHPVDPAAVYCAARGDLVLVIDGAPLVYSTGYAHDLAVRLTGKSGALDLPARADPARGGVVVDAASAAGRADLSDDGQLIGAWGFGAFEGPKLRFVTPKPQIWKAKGLAQASLIIGQESTLQLAGHDSACIESVRLQTPAAGETPLNWSASAPDELTVHLPPKPVGGGEFKLLIRTAGLKTADVVPLGLYSKPAEIADFAFHAGDHSAQLTGARLDEIQDVVVEGARFTPLLGPPNAEAQLDLVLAEGQTLAPLSAGDTIAGQARLKDGRSVGFRATVGPARPQVAVINRDLQTEPQADALPIRLGGQDAMPRRSKLTFAVRAAPPLSFTGRETLQIETANGAFTAELNAAEGLMLQDPQVAVASLDLQKKFGASAFGPLRFRVVKDQVASDWQPLGVLVRLPQVTSVRCGSGRQAGCTLKGQNLFLIAAVAASFENAVSVPDGLSVETLQVPHPHGRKLYLKLRDDPGSISTLALSPTG